MNWERSSGTLLPLPALYLFGPPMNSLGLGSSLSAWKLNLSSSILVGPALVNEVPSPADTPLWFDDPFERVYKLESNVDRLGGCDVVLDPGELVGARAGADGLETALGNGNDTGAEG